MFFVMCVITQSFWKHLAATSIFSLSLLPRLLDQWAGHRTIRTKHATIPRLRAQQRATIFAVIVKLAGIGWHSLRFLMSTMGTGDS